MDAGAEKKLLIVKLVHTTIWLFFVLVIGYILYKGIWGEIDPSVLAANALIIGEGIVLALNKWKCPLTIVGARYSESRADNFDIFLPLWLARNNKLIFTSIYCCALLIVLFRLLH